MEQNSRPTVGERRARLIALLVFVSVIISLAVVGVTYALRSEERVCLSKEEILSRIETVNSASDYDFVAEYIEDYGIVGFDTRKLRMCEISFLQYTIYEMKSTEQLATECAELFVELMYDKVDLADKVAFTDAVISCFIGATGDRYAVYRNAKQYENYNTDMSGSFVGIGVQVRQDTALGTLTVLDVYEGSGAEEAGIKVGDLITAVDGQLLADIGYDALVSAIRGEEGTTVTVTVDRGGVILDLIATRRKVVEKTVRYSIDEGKIAYIKITGFKDNTAEMFADTIDRAEAEGARGIVFDLRDNPGGYLHSVLAMLDYLAPDGERIASYKSFTDVNEQIILASDGHAVDLPMVVLMNGGTASAGELFSAALRDWGASGVLDVVTVGERTYAKGVMQSTFGFGDGSTLTMTIAYYNPPSGVNYDGIGITPDVVLENTGTTDDQLARAYIEIEQLIQTANAA